MSEAANQLTKLQQADRMLAEVETAEDAANLADYAAAAKVYAQKARLGTSSINHATAIRVKAERRIAEMVDRGQEAGQIARPGQPEKPKSITTSGSNTSPKPLAEVLQTETQKNASKRLKEARSIARNYPTDEAVDQVVAKANQDDRPLTRQEFVKGKAHVANNSGENEWYTPPEYITAARNTLGGAINTDPATSELAQRTVQADTFHTIHDDGLTKEWHGTVWMNPPYSQPQIGQFINKLIHEHQQGRTTAAIVLVNNGTDTAWGQTLLTAATAVCFPNRRIKFIDKDGNPGAPLQGQMVAYLGDNPAAFTSEFATFGAVLHV